MRGWAIIIVSTNLNKD